MPRADYAMMVLLVAAASLATAGCDLATAGIAGDAGAKAVDAQARAVTHDGGGAVDVAVVRDAGADRGAVAAEDAGHRREDSGHDGGHDAGRDAGRMACVACGALTDCPDEPPCQVSVSCDDGCCGSAAAPTTTMCGNGSHCDGKGGCACMHAGDCALPGFEDSKCAMASCAAGVCAVDYAEPGVACMVAPGLPGTCNGAGICAAPLDAGHS
jgi:hypothetical protein